MADNPSSSDTNPTLDRSIATPFPAFGDGVVIRAVGLKKNFGRVRALTGVSLEVRRGEVLCIMGPNGAGKTTLLYLLAGLLFPSEGHVTVFGQHRWRENYEIRRRSTILPTLPVYGGSPTPYEYLRLLAQIYGLPKDMFVERLRQLCEEMDYLPHLTKEWPQISPGLQKKAGLIGSFLVNVELRILDQPFAGGVDPMGMEVLLRWMAQARSRGETTLFTTQVPDLAEAAADRIALLCQGHLDLLATSREIIEKAGLSPDEPRAFSRAFLGIIKDRWNA
jgi:ABC-type multidrug transport system ATPase subunit